MSDTQASGAIINHASGPARSSHPPFLAPLRPSYFIARPDGVLVPLVPVDELSPQIRLPGTGRFLTYQETFGMQYVGTLPYTGKYYDLDAARMISGAASLPLSISAPWHAPIPHHSPSEKRFLASDAMIRLGMSVADSNARTTPSASLHQDPQSRPVSAAASATDWRKPASDSIETTQATIDAILAANINTAKADGLASKSALPASGAAPDQEKKIYCTHWVRHGECDYTQQGCLYKHEMPDKATLESIGFRTVPRWYLEKTAPKLEGMSSKPTVGLPMRAAEWLKPSGDSDSDVGDNSSISDLSDINDDVAKMGVESAPEIESKPVESKPSPTFSFELVSSPDGVPADSGDRKSSSDGNLIDFDYPPCAMGVYVDRSNPIFSSPSTSPSSSKHGSPKQVSASPTITKSTADHKSRPHKVFVPAGESPEQHIAEARVHSTRTRGTEEASLRVDAPTTGTDVVGTSSAACEKSSQLVAAPRKDGMMASKHAPPSLFEADKLRRPYEEWRQARGSRSQAYWLEREGEGQHCEGGQATGYNWYGEAKELVKMSAVDGA
ncbi:hypothetical protein B0A48_16832 [Cryoendolithus antarcticus]|uniref:C3H1-type domain-containing protein n=1 Tax=Cryoendolithus antarcticus TaxID=1507870 RepID=A0A1V8SCX6_9PEZI|nr:hypothetical protein B0A48_16832 [Cryoendolithus antarcticus]